MGSAILTLSLIGATIAGGMANFALQKYLQARTGTLLEGISHSRHRRYDPDLESIWTTIGKIKGKSRRVVERQF